MKNCPVCNQTLPDFNIGVRIRAHRYEIGMSISQLAEITGLNRSSILKIEKGERTPRAETLDLIKGAFGVRVL